jgi:hypothetical protein
VTLEGLIMRGPHTNEFQLDIQALQPTSIHDTLLQLPKSHQHMLWHCLSELLHYMPLQHDSTGNSLTLQEIEMKA